MVRAILRVKSETDHAAFPKTQTRRVMKPQPSEEWTPMREMVEINGCINGQLSPAKVLGIGFCSVDGDECYVCHYGQSGDRLWVKETFYHWGKWIKNGLTKKGRQAWKFNSLNSNECLYGATSPPAEPGKIKRTEVAWHKRPSIFMPRNFSRINLEIVKVRVERLQDISHRAALAEGVEYDVSKPDGSPLARYQQLWESINGKGSWAKNPWVWVIEFQRLNAEV